MGTSLQAEQVDIWHAVTDGIAGIADGCCDRQHVISARIERSRQRFRQHQLLITDEYLHFGLPLAASRTNSAIVTGSGLSSTAFSRSH
jgi:hypothetical protein